MDVHQKPGRNRDMIYSRSVLNIFLRKNNYNKPNKYNEKSSKFCK